MDEKRIGKGGRSGRDRRNRCTSSYNGPERRCIKYRRSDKDSRDKRVTDKIKFVARKGSLIIE